jgi:AraC family transcriptional activator of pobA
VQFGAEVISSVPLRVLLQQHFLSELPAIFFERDKKLFKRMETVLDILQDALQRNTQVSREVSIQMLQTLLLMLLDIKQTGQPATLSGDRKMLFRFQQILDEQFHNNHQVARYAGELGTTERKLAAITKEFLGLSPLQVIHNRVLLEAKRLLLFEQTSHKEIAFQLGFDSPASFSLFIKNKTGYSPSELNLQLVNFHKQ